MKAALLLRSLLATTLPHPPVTKFIIKILLLGSIKRSNQTIIYINTIILIVIFTLLFQAVNLEGVDTILTANGILS